MVELSLEAAIISETKTLLRNIDRLNYSIETIDENELARLGEQLRKIEKLMSPVYVFFKASVYTTNDIEKSTNRPPLP